MGRFLLSSWFASGTFLAHNSGRAGETDMEQLGTLETICRYPVKSMAGEEIGEAFVGYGGVLGDRVYGFIRAGGMRGFPWHTAREQEDLVKYRPRFRRSGEAGGLAEIDFSLAL